MKTENPLETKIAQAYQVIGTLLTRSGNFETKEGQRALDYFSSNTVDENFLSFNPET